MESVRSSESGGTSVKCDVGNGQTLTSPAGGETQERDAGQGPLTGDLFEATDRRLRTAYAPKRNRAPF